jgi:malonate decarboxylase epsilon subunit
LVAKRAELMQQAYPNGYGMTAIIGADRFQVESWIAKVASDSQKVFIANLNAENQVVISGSFDAMQRVAKYANESGAISKKIEISVPSHCMLLENKHSNSRVW